MKMLFALGLSAGILVGCYMWLSLAVPVLGLITWISLISAGAYFYAGTGIKGLVDPMAAGVSGVLFTVIALYLIGVFGGGIMPFTIIVALLAFSIVMFSGVPLFSDIPAAFMAAAAYVGSGGGLDSSIFFVLSSWAGGLVLAFGIDKFSKLIANTDRASNA